MNDMIIDGHVHLSAELEEGAFRALPLDAEQLLKLMQGPFSIAGQNRVVDRALVQPPISATRLGHPLDQHRYVAAQVKAHPQRLVGCFTANPLLDVAETVEALRELVERGGFRALKLHPTGHAYLPFRLRDRLDPLVAEAGRLGIPVLVHQGDPPFGHPSQVAPLIEAFPRVPFILAHFATQRLVMADEAIYVARKNPNVYLETGWGTLPRIKEGLAALGPGRLVFGSDCPVQEMGSQLRVLEVLAWDPPLGARLAPEGVEQIMGDNLAALLGVGEAR
ncbi:MAG: amidohydrolase [Chloroflexi bacterium]|nr:amidohydrolase [Chloroflexota bacterium]